MTYGLLAVASDLSWLLMLGITSFGVKFLKDLTHSVDRLNDNIGTVINRIDNHEMRLNDHESRIKELEYD